MTSPKFFEETDDMDIDTENLAHDPDVQRVLRGMRSLDVKIGRKTYKGAAEVEFDDATGHVTLEFEKGRKHGA